MIDDLTKILGRKAGRIAIACNSDVSLGCINYSGNRVNRKRPGKDGRILPSGFEYKGTADGLVQHAVQELTEADAKNLLRFFWVNDKNAIDGYQKQSKRALEYLRKHTKLYKEFRNVSEDDKRI